MTIQHRLIPNSELHEPKDINTAAIGTAYIADGAGSGDWKSIAAYGSMVITNNSTNFPLTAVADTTFNTASQFTLLTGTGAPWASETLFGMTFNTNRLIVPVTGVYLINLWMNILGFPSTTSKVAIRYRINGTGAFSTRKPTIKSAVASDVSPLVGHGLVELNAGDYIQLYVASDTTGNLLIGDANNLLQLVRQTA